MKYVKTFILTVILSITLSGFIIAQESDPEWVPELTENWTPVDDTVQTGSPGEAPSDAIHLFDGTDLSAWVSSNDDRQDAGWAIDDGAVTVVPGSGNIQTRRRFGDVQLHIEWKTPEVIDGDGQGRGNSGVFLQGIYEVQILDSWQNSTYSNGQAGSIYKQKAPDVNASKAPGEWQSFDIIFEAPRFEEDGSLIKPAYITVHHNGVLIHHRYELDGPTKYIGLPEYTPHAEKLPIMLQDHSDNISFRNIWVREL